MNSHKYHNNSSSSSSPQFKTLEHLPTHNKPKFNNLIRKFQAQLQQLCQTDTVEDEIKENSPGNWENQLHENIKIATVIVPNCEGDINR